MANPFDEFDSEPPRASTSKANPFDEFDPKPAQYDPSVSQAPSGPLRETALAGSGLAHGLANTLGLPGDFEKWMSPAVSSQFRTLPTSGELLAWTQSHGLTDRPDLIPQTAGERYLSAGAEGLGSTAPMLAMGGVPSLGAKLVNLAAGAGGGLAGQGVQDLGLPSWAGPLAGAGVGALLSGAHGLATMGSAAGPIVHGIGGIFGGELGAHAGDILAQLAGMPPRASAAAGGLLGMLAPSAWRGISSAVSNPSELMPLAVGAMGGANPLISPSQPQSWQTQARATLPVRQPEGLSSSPAWPENKAWYATLPPPAYEQREWYAPLPSGIISSR